ncbi:MAG: 30S ribosomal protein S2 [Nanoarchaeota archaeon]
MPRKKKSDLESSEVVSETPEKVKKISKKKTEEALEDTDLKKRTSDRSVLIKELKEKAKKLQASIEGIGTEDIKEELEKKRELLVPLEDYVKTGIHLGTRVITPDMRPFVYRRRADSIGVLNTSLIDEQIKKAVDLVSKYDPESIILACKREAGWKSASLFSEITGIKVFTKKYPAGMMTNTALETFYEPELVIVSDPWIDKNALNDATLTNKKKIILCDTNNFTAHADLVIPCNNKGSKSLGLIFYLLAKGYIEKRKINVKMPSMSAFVEDESDSQDIQYIQEAPKEISA